VNSLSPPQELHAGDKLVSNNGYFTLEMYPVGALALYRTQVRWTMWTSTPLDQPGGFAVMQDDGNFVAYSPAGVPYWATNTDGHPGAWLALLDDGNLVVLDGQSVLWQTNTVTDLRAPTIRYVREGGYSYNETSESWKAMCAAFPCFLALQWPGYASAIVEDVVDGMPIVIQLWKGLCPKFGGFAGLQTFPGGVGAEVGIYRRIPGKAPPTSFPGLPSLGYAEKLVNEVGTGAGVDLWWPAPELNTTLEFRFINPVTNEVVFSAGPQTGYWLTKWMDEPAYSDYQRDHAVPAGYTDYILEFTVNGKRYRTWPPMPGDLGGVAEAAWLLLLDGEKPKPRGLSGVAEAASLLLLDGEKPQSRGLRGVAEAASLLLLDKEEPTPPPAPRPRPPRPRPHH